MLWPSRFGTLYLALGSDAWETRVARLAGWIARDGDVLDLGCGAMRLERHLRAANRYVPIDCVARDARTQVMNLDDPPRLSGEIAVMSGVLEYLESPARLVDAIGDCRQALFSYCPRENFRWRRARGWRNHLMKDEIADLFCRRGWRIARSDSSGRNVLYDARR